MTEFTLPACLKCKEVQKNCCNDNPFASLAIEDVDKIISLGFKLKDFAIAGEYDKEKIKNDEDWWKNNMIIKDGRIYKLNMKKKNDGSCYFLKDGKGCVLNESRPYICKIYPFWMNSSDEIIFEPGEEDYCFIIRNGAAIDEALKLIKETKNSIGYYFSKIKGDCVENKDKHEKIILELLK